MNKKHRENQRQYVERMRARGLKWVSVWVPEEDEHLLKDYAEELRGRYNEIKEKSSDE